MPSHCRMRAIDRDRSAQGIMASGPVCRTNRPTHGCTDQCCKREESSCQLEPSTHGTKLGVQRSVGWPLVQLDLISTNLHHTDEAIGADRDRTIYQSSWS